MQVYTNLMVHPMSHTAERLSTKARNPCAGHVVQASVLNKLGAATEAVEKEKSLGCFLLPC